MRALSLILLVLASCAVVDDADTDEGVVEQDTTTVWYTPITREYFLPSAKVATEAHRVFKSEAQWVAFFGAPSPGIDFSTRWAIFYTPGTQRADLVDEQGWQAKLARVTVSSTGKTLSITTKLEHNGDCAARKG